MPTTNPTLAARAGFVVGKKVHKKAVKRNRIKRLIREAYKDISKTRTFSLKVYGTMIFIARPAIIESDYKTVHAAVADCVKKADKRYNK